MGTHSSAFHGGQNTCTNVLHPIEKILGDVWGNTDISQRVEYQKLF